MTYSGIIIFILGVAGSGKNTMIKLLMQQYPSIKQIISYKTRPLRPGEEDGVDYHYMDETTFEQKVEEGYFLEHARVHDMYYYGTAKDDVVRCLEVGGVYLKEIDIQGLTDILTEHPDVARYSLSLFLNLSETTMIERITKRAPIAEEELQERLESAINEREIAKQYCTYIVSAEGTIEEVYESVSTHIKSYLQKHTSFTL